MEPSRPNALPVHEPRRFPVAPVVFGLIIAVLAGWITVTAVNHRDPVDVVEDYLTAVAEKDLEAAYELVSPYGYGVPYGDTATFLTPDAISDGWWVVSVEEIDREYSTSATVKAVIAGPGGTSSGVFEVDEYDDEWRLEDPFVRVRFPASPLSFIQVNGMTVPRKDTTNAAYETYSLFPGPYRFYESKPEVYGAQEVGPVVAFPPPESASSLDERTVFPPTLTAERKTVEKAQRAVRKRIDECVTFATPTPTDCPFATDGEIDTADGRRVNGLHTLTWKVQEYPTIKLTDDRSDENAPGFAVSAEKTGTVTLTGTGLDTDDNPTTFTVTCDMDLSGLIATLDLDGNVALGESRFQADGTANTCRRNA